MEEKCLSCGTKDSFCDTNSSYLCESCLSQTTKRAEAVSNVANKRYEQLQVTVEVATKEFNRLTVINEKLEEGVLQANFTLESVVESNIVLAKGIIKLEEKLEAERDKNKT